MHKLIGIYRNIYIVKNIKIIMGKILTGRIYEKETKKHMDLASK